jgi:hypothetical protein
VRGSVSPAFDGLYVKALAGEPVLPRPDYRQGNRQRQGKGACEAGGKAAEGWLSRSLPLHYFRRRIEHRAIVAMFVDELPRLLNGNCVFPGEILNLICLAAGNAISIPRTAL